MGLQHKSLAPGGTFQARRHGAPQSSSMYLWMGMAEGVGMERKGAVVVAAAALAIVVLAMMVVVVVTG